MNTTNIKVEGMDCSSCALSIKKCLEKKGFDNVNVNYVNGQVSFIDNYNTSINIIKKEIEELGYKVVDNNKDFNEKNEYESAGFLKSHFQKFLFCLFFALPLFIGHIVNIHWIMNTKFQAFLATPVYLLGMSYFGVSAWRSLRKGYPNMNVLIALGSTVAYWYSVYGLLVETSMENIFFETTTTTLTLVFLGNYLEDYTHKQTQKAVDALIQNQPQKATMIAFDESYKEQYFEVDAKLLKIGDLIFIKTGEKVAADCKVLHGTGTVNESIITGESDPVLKESKSTLLGGSVVVEGNFKAQVTAENSNSVLGQIIKLIHKAQAEKPPMQKLADKISAIFVPSVLIIATATFLLNYYLFETNFANSLLRCITVLVIACPCAMGIATPAAIAVGLGRATKNGVLFKDSSSLEVFKDIKQIVFDKTGTLTTGKFAITNYFIYDKSINDNEFKSLVYALEKISNHPIAQAINNAWKTINDTKWQKINEVKGLGIIAIDKDGIEYKATSYKGVENLITDHTHNIYITKNNNLIGYIDVEDEIRPEAKSVISTLKSYGMNCILLSGDKKEKCDIVAKKLEINIVYAEQKPENKLNIIADLNKAKPTAMIGDGINDAAALAKASVGISLGNASDMAIQTAHVILMQNNLSKLPFIFGIGKHTYKTIQSNLFWALIYNVVAIPIAAFGLLGSFGPTYGALIMGLSDVVLAINSIWLKWKKIL